MASVRTNNQAGKPYHEALAPGSVSNDDDLKQNLDEDELKNGESFDTVHPFLPHNSTDPLIVLCTYFRWKRIRRRYAVLNAYCWTHRELVICMLYTGDQRLKNFIVNRSLPLELYQALTKEGVKFDDLEYLTTHDVDALCSKYNIPLGAKAKFKKYHEKHQMKLHEEHYEPQPGEKLKRDDDKEFDHKMKVILIGDCQVGKTQVRSRSLQRMSVLSPLFI